MSVAYWAGYPKSYTPGRDPAHPIQYIVVHCTEGSEGPTAAEDGHHYDTVRTDGTSTHVFVDPNSVAREVPDQDQAHAARMHGNKIGLQMELCGVASQTRSQWLDGNSYAMLRLAAKMAAEWCQLHSIPVKRLSVEQCRAAYYAPAGQRPKGIVSHGDVTLAYPEDAGSHTDPGPNFPWDVFFSLINQELTGGGDVPKTFVINEAVQGPSGPIAAGALYASGGAGFFHIEDPDDATFYGQTWGIDPFSTGNPMSLAEANRRFGPFLGEHNQLAAGPKGDKGDAGADGAGFAPGQTVTITGPVVVS